MALKLTNNWEFDVLGIYNYTKPGSFEGYLKFLKRNHKKIKGDLLEAGVFKENLCYLLPYILKK